MKTVPAILRIGFLGIDADTLELVHAIAHSQGYTIAGYTEIDVATSHGDLPNVSLFGRYRRFESWESFLDQDQFDVVVVCRSDDQDRRAEQLRKLIQVGVPVVVSHPVVDSMLVYYELDMIHRDTGSLVMPFLPARHRPAVQSLASWSAQNGSSPLGRIEQVLMERGLPEPTRANVARQFARDVDVIRAIAGDLTRLGAMAIDGHAAQYAGLGVQMTGPRGITARWSVDPARDPNSAQLTVLGTGGKAVVDLATGRGESSIELVLGGERSTETFGSFDPAVDFLDRLHAALAGAAVEPDWVDAARSVELAETIDRSLAKSRTIELHYEEYTEQGTFKGTMTSVGCGLLILGLFLLAAVAIAEQLGVPYVRHWPKALAAVLGLFLLLQLLMLVFPKAPPGEGEVPRSSS